MASQLHSDPNTNIGQEKANHLINENSPYLLMHAKNPVDWYPWGQEGLDKAKKENKLLIISIGYSACHWCHVMEKESFSDEEVAKVMNEQFISIKVDREEHPDVDQVYMDAALLVNGTGGWPLNAIALPDGRPVFAGTYYPKNQWMYVLQELTNLFKNNPAKLEEQAIALTQGIQLHEKFAIKENDENVSREELDNIVHNILKNVDFQFGGHDVAPKFPIPVAYEFLLEYAYYTKNEKALEAVEITLKNMAWGGIYDQIGGGFARYSVDKYWIVPHFEKMLYDNAQLLSLYANAFLVSGKELYRQIVHQTAEFIKRELTDPRGGFYSSIDADSEGEEGKYYSWTKKEFTDILEEDAELVADYYNISGKGNWEAGKNTLYKDEDDEKFAKKWNMPLSSLKKIISTANEKLFKVREKRVKPARDTKIITAWNGLMISAFIKTYQALKDPSYLQIAIDRALFLQKSFVEKEGKVYRTSKKDDYINGFLDDYSFLIGAYLDLYQVTFEETWLERAKKMEEYVMKHFYDDSTGMFYYTSDVGEKLIARNMEISDNVIPSSNSSMARNLFVLGKLLGEQMYVEKSFRMLRNVKSEMVKGSFYYANWDRLYNLFLEGTYELVITGKNYHETINDFKYMFLPNVVILGGDDNSSLQVVKNKYSPGKELIHVCKDQKCYLPVDSSNQALEMIRSYK